MGQLNLKIASRRDDATLQRIFQTPGSGAKHAVGQHLVNFIQGLISGSELGPSGEAPSVAISVEGQAVAASGTFTLASVIATDAISINGVTFTCVASGATGNQFNVGVSDTATAANLAAAINASVTALVSGYVTASAAATVVTVSAAIPGILGNAITIASADATITASGARLTGGAADSSAITLSF
jgi:phage tail sheath gpL-like